MTRQRRFPIGVEVVSGGQASVRVWAPARRKVELLRLADGKKFALAPEQGGYFSAELELAVGTRYGFRLDDAERWFPDPASRFQPEGPEGPSELVDPSFAWTDAGWPGLTRPSQVVSEIHIGSFTTEGSFRAAASKLPHLVDVGITCVELMPLADFPGRFGWGYDGVNMFAPTRLYGRPEDLRFFVDRAHALGLGVILDVVYNHFGPSGNYLEQFSNEWFTDRYANEWGRAIDFETAAGVREFFAENARYWIEEFHFDGLRLDATQTIHDASPEPIIAEIMRRLRERIDKPVWVIAENEAQDSRLIRPRERGGMGVSAVWNDDFHHSAMVAVTGRKEAYYSDYLGRPQELISAVKRGYLYQGQWYGWQHGNRGSSALDLPATAFLHYLQNHDQIANSGSGLRLQQLTSPGRYRAITSLLLLAPQSPLLFQGQEFAASAPFLYFADQAEDIAPLVRKGRAEFLAQFPSLAGADMQARLADPKSEATFLRCKIDWDERERERHAEALELHRSLLGLRRQDPVFARGYELAIDGAVLGPEALCLRWFGAEHGDRLLLVNLGTDLAIAGLAEPLLAPLEGGWTLLFSSEDPRFGGGGTPALDFAGAWVLPGQCCLLLQGQGREQS